jgi:hypothetical protein
MAESKELKKPVPVLYPLTEEAEQSIKDREIKLDKFPFRIGRQSRSNGRNGSGGKFDRRLPGNSPNNDYYLIDGGRHLNISREHLQIEKREDGSYEVLDRGSTCGTSVDDHHIGGSNKKVRYPLKKGSILVLGTPGSPYVFKFLLSSG